MPKPRHWYTWRTSKDAPSHIADQALDKFGAYAEGWNDAVQAYLDETEAAIRKEQRDRDR